MLFRGHNGEYYRVAKVRGNQEMSRNFNKLGRTGNVRENDENVRENDENVR